MSTSWRGSAAAAVLFAAVLLAVTPAAARPAVAFGSAVAGSARLPSADLFDHANFDRVLKTHVITGGVDYASLKADRAALDAYVRDLASVDSSTFDSWPRDEQVAYLINAYNAFVLLGVIDHYPIRRSIRPVAWVRPANSIWQIRGFFDRRRYQAAGRSLTLDDIEHVWLRDVLSEPRVHFALVCAARSCPPLRPEAFVPGRLDAQLDSQARIFFSNPRVNHFDADAKVVRLSSILSWFGEDFERYAPPTGFAGSAAERGAVAFASRFLPEETVTWLRSGDYRVEYFPYDWRLNDRRR